MQGHFTQQQSTNKSEISRTHSINMLTAGMASRLGSGQASSSSKPAVGVQVDHQADPQAVPAKRLEQTPKEICAGGDVFSFGGDPADSSEKSAIRDFVINHRSGTHTEFQMKPMPLSDADINLLIKFQQELNIPHTGGCRRYFLVNAMYEITQRFWTLDDVFKKTLSILGRSRLSRKNSPSAETTLSTKRC